MPQQTIPKDMGDVFFPSSTSRTCRVITHPHAISKSLRPRLAIRTLYFQSAKPAFKVSNFSNKSPEDAS
ncbi:hypothetical protein F383_25059 [Gossypium arboreum]|uniref:Uncharacterized protein n=1 Tax=Gossypium arboreum TaxID=29729 RepID=A0A0B0P588_GOSAR|nr:hypothetical protein F383_25059 [Gossypium arboreum]